VLKQSLLDEVYQLDLADAHQLNKLLVSHIYTMQKTYSLVAKSMFSMGDRVCFLYEGTKYAGIINKMLRMYASVALIDTATNKLSDRIIKVTYRALQKDKQ